MFPVRRVVKIIFAIGRNADQATQRITEDSTANLFYKIPEVLSFLSHYMTLLPGDVVSLGTALKRSAPGSRAVQNVELDKLGGPVAVSISGLGTLENPVRLVESGAPRPQRT